MDVVDEEEAMGDTSDKEEADHDAESLFNLIE